MNIDKMIEKAMKDTNYKNKLAKSFGDYSRFEKKKNIIDEELFSIFLSSIQEDEKLLVFFRDIKIYIINEENVTDKIFNQLISLANISGFSWLYFDLCHAKLKESQINYLKSLDLNEAYFY